jgi:hypothetical protein
MPTLPTAEWTVALDQMTVALDQTLLDLDRYRTTWATLTDSGATATPPELMLAWLERRLAQWDDRLNAAAELAASVESQLEDREAAVGRWHEVFVRWKELIQRRVDTSSISPG